jgi:hypothetical protein
MQARIGTTTKARRIALSLTHDHLNHFTNPAWRAFDSAQQRDLTRRQDIDVAAAQVFQLL